jgi:hypothetical protein
MCPYNTYISKDQELFAAHLESARKDVECVFGTLKKRWSCLKNPILIQDQDRIDDVFMTCCILHNMLLQYDYGDVEEDEEDEEINQENSRIDARLRRYRRILDKNQIGHRWTFAFELDENETVEDLNEFNSRRQKLAVHFKYIYDNHRDWIRF